MMKRKTGWSVTFWIIVALIVYPLSTGPAILLEGTLGFPARLGYLLDAVYAPLHWTLDRFPQSVRDWHIQYLSLWLRN